MLLTDDFLVCYRLPGHYCGMETDSGCAMLEDYAVYRGNVYQLRDDGRSYSGRKSGQVHRSMAFASEVELLVCGYKPVACKFTDAVLAQFLTDAAHD